MTPSPHYSNQPRKKRIKIPTPDYLANVALYYLSRFAASEASFRRVLENRLRRAAIAHPDFAADHAKQETLKRAIDTLVAQHKKSGALNDEAFAAMKVRSLRRSGRSTRHITQKLRTKGIAPPLIESALKPEDEGAPPDAADRAAALAFAKRKALGPFRRAPTGPQRLAPDELKRKEFAAMARAGFTYDIVKAVLGGDPDYEDWQY